jgi:FkbM family methyltransferase
MNRARIIQLLKSAMPARLRFWLSMQWQYRTQPEPEMRLLGALCDRGGVAVDVGANYGTYSFFLRRHAKSVVAFEPVPFLAQRLRRVLPRGVDIRQCAVSDHAGTEELRIPLEDGEPHFGIASLEPGSHRNAKSLQSTCVPVVTLDESGLDDVGFIKIDVEGHEHAVLCGAQDILRVQRPCVLVEIEERHRPGGLDVTTSFMRDLGYDGFFLQDGKLQPIATFDRDALQDPRALSDNFKRPGATYINNFIFLPQGDDIGRKLA